MKTPLIAGNPLELLNHSETGNGERDGLKTEKIGQSAAKHLSDGVGSTTRQVMYTQASGNGEHLTRDEDIVSSISKDVAAKMNYVYALLDPRKPGEYEYGHFCFDYEPFYIGVGTKDRIDTHRKEALQWKHVKIITPKISKIRAISKQGFEIITRKVSVNLSREEAFKIEISLIALIGKKIEGKGCLTNIVDGGEGAKGLPGHLNPGYGKGDRIRGEKNPNWGKHGPAHHLYGKPAQVTKLKGKARKDYLAKRSALALVQWDNYSEEQRQKLRKERSEGQKEYWAAMSTIARESIGKKISAHKKVFWGSKSPEERSEITSIGSRAAAAKIAAFSDSEKKAYSESQSEGGKARWAKLKADPVAFAAYKAKVRATRLKNLEKKQFINSDQTISDV